MASELHGIYNDPDGIYPHLKGKTALLQDAGNFYLAQFDELSVPEALGWWSFRKDEFTLES
jgi:hypothetical protein